MGKQALTRFFSEGLRPPEMAKSRVHMLSCGQQFFSVLSLWDNPQNGDLLTRVIKELLSEMVLQVVNAPFAMDIAINYKLVNR